MARPIWSGWISFGLVNVPVKLLTATQDKDVHFHQLHRKDHARVQYRIFCPAHNHEISRDEVVRGFEVGPDRYVAVEQKELDSLAPEKSRAIELTEFVDLKDIDPMFYDRPYYLVPDEGAAKAYQLLVQAMEKSRKVGITRFVMRNKEYLAAIRPVEGVLCLEVMRFADEVVSARDVGLPKKAPVTERELAMAQQLIDSLAGEFEPHKYRDDYRERLLELIHRKAKGRQVVLQPPAEEPRGRVINLMKALEESVQAAQKEREPRKRRKASA